MAFLPMEETPGSTIGVLKLVLPPNFLAKILANGDTVTEPAIPTLRLGNVV